MAESLSAALTSQEGRSETGLPPGPAARQTGGADREPPPATRPPADRTRWFTETELATAASIRPVPASEQAYGHGADVGCHGAHHTDTGPRCQETGEITQTRQWWAGMDVRETVCVFREHSKLIPIGCSLG